MKSFWKKQGNKVMMFKIFYNKCSEIKMIKIVFIIILNSYSVAKRFRLKKRSLRRKYNSTDEV